MAPADAGRDAPVPAPAAPPADARGRALELLREGNILAGQGDFGAALEQFRAAYAVFPSVKLLLNIGTSLRQVGRNAEAAQTYERYLAHPEAEPARAKELRRILRELDQLTGRLRLRSSQPGALVRLDGRLLAPGAAASEIRVDPGEHTIVAEKPGLVTVVRTVTVPVRERVEVELLLLPPGTPPPVVVHATAGGTQRAVGYVLGAIGHGGLAAGSIFGALALANDAAAADNCRPDEPAVCDAEGASLGQTARAQGTAATVLLGVGGALFATAVVVWSTAPWPEKPRERARLSPVVLGAHGGGVALALPW